MSSTDGPREAPLVSTRMRDKQLVGDYRVTWLKKLIDKLFPSSGLKVRPASHSGAR